MALKNGGMEVSDQITVELFFTGNIVFGIRIFCFCAHYLSDGFCFGIFIFIAQVVAHVGNSYGKTK